jgi:hypothetical protein
VQADTKFFSDAESEEEDDDDETEKLKKKKKDKPLFLKASLWVPILGFPGVFPRQVGWKLLY